mgnify:CR=1 FL=1
MNKGMYGVFCLMVLLALPGCWPSKEEKAPEAPQQEVAVAVESQETKEIKATPAPTEQKSTDTKQVGEVPSKI